MVHIVACVKYTVDITKLSFDPITREPIFTGVPRKIGDMDLRAIEEAVRIKESIGGEVTAITVGHPESIKALERAYAMGADRGYLVTVPDLEKIDVDTTARAIVAVIRMIGKYDMVICGSASSDHFNWQVPSKIAALLDLPIITCVRKMQVSQNEVIAECEFEDVIYTTKVTLPAVIGVTLELNKPRIPSIRDVLQARRKETVQYSLSDLGIEYKPSVLTKEIKAIEVKRKGIIFDASKPDKVREAVSKLIDALREEGVL